MNSFHMEPRRQSKSGSLWSKERDGPSFRNTQHLVATKMNNDRRSFRNINKKPGLQIWSINDMQMSAVPARTYGNFFEGDCYIVLNIRESKYSTQLASDIHYWIGKTSSQDEQGAAAILVTQIDDHLGGLPVQHREVQGYESIRFKSYFKNGIIYKKGGVASGFKHVVTNSYNVLRLLHVKGRKNVIATEVDVSWASFNNDDIFLLDVGKAIVQWSGPQSNRKEMLKAILLAQDIRDRERGGRAQIGIVEGGQEQDSPELMKIMTSVLGPKPSQLKRGTPDDQADGMFTDIIRLYHVYEQSGNLVVQEVAVQPLTQDLLLSSDCYILDHGGSCVMVWKGKNASPAERKGALNRAVGFIKAKNYPSITRVEVMAEGGESAMFKQLFQSWTEKGQTQGLGTTHSFGKIAKVDQVKFDVMQLHARPELAAYHRMVDDACGDVKVWRIEKLELAEVKPRTYGQFYGGDCYLVLYTYQKAGQPQYIIYMWQGRHATQDEITACAFQAVNIDNQFNGAPVQVRVVMGKEPRHFLAIFKGKFIIFEGGTGRSNGAYLDSGVKLFQVRGTDEMNTMATEVPPKAASLNSNDVFLLKTNHICYLWYGKGCNGDERVMGRSISDVISRQEKQVVTEGQEPHEFWISLGGKAPYACGREFEEEKPAYSPRLFECSNQTGQFRMTEVGDVSQCDLDEEDVMLLDTWHDIFLWVGKLANEVETRESWRSAVEYLRSHPAGRDPDTPIIFVKQGHEPPTFTGWFNAWDPLKWSELGNTDLTTTDGYRAPGGPTSPIPFYRVHGDVSARRSNPSSPSTPRVQHFVPLSPIRNYSPTQPRAKAFSPEHLLGKDPSELPEGVDASQREVYLSDEDFENVIGTSRADFLRLPKWRQDDLKKKAGIF
ncbi:villin-1 isoform 2-T2 [Synchiropus picturatus]